jgi:hypothetical protein
MRLKRRVQDVPHDLPPLPLREIIPSFATQGCDISSAPAIVADTGKRKRPHGNPYGRFLDTKGCD